MRNMLTAVLLATCVILVMLLISNWDGWHFAGLIGFIFLICLLRAEAHWEGRHSRNGGGGG